MEFACSTVFFCGSRGGRRAQQEARFQARGYCEDRPVTIISNDSLQVLALAVPLDESLQAFLLPAIQQAFHTILKTFSENFRAAREVIAQDAPLLPHLVCREYQRHASDAHDQGQDDFQSRAHRDSSIQI